MRLIYFLFRDFFIISGLGLLILLIMEDLQPGFVSFWWPMEYLLIPVMVSGFLALITSRFSLVHSQESKKMIN